MTHSVVHRLVIEIDIEHMISVFFDSQREIFVELRHFDVHV